MVAVPLAHRGGPRRGVDQIKPLTAVDEDQDADRPTDRESESAGAGRTASTQARRQRFRPGPSVRWTASWLEPPGQEVPETALGQEVETIARAVEEHQAIEVRQLYRVVGARYWGPGEYRHALREALAQRRIRRAGGRRLATVEQERSAP